MNAVHILERCRSAPQEKESIRQSIERYRDGAMSISRYGLAAGGHGSSEGDKLADIAVRVSEKEDALAKREREYAAEISAACLLLDRLPDQESGVLHLFYLQGYTLASVAQRVHNSYSYVRKLKADGLTLAEGVPLLDVALAMPAWYLQQELQRLNDFIEIGDYRPEQTDSLIRERDAIREALRMGGRGVIMDAVMQRAVELVVGERHRQTDKWGDESGNHPFQWMSILMEEVGELAEAVNETVNETCFPSPHVKPERGGRAAILREAVQVAAVAVAIAEAVIAENGREERAKPADNAVDAFLREGLD